MKKKHWFVQWDDPKTEEKNIVRHDDFFEMVSGVTVLRNEGIFPTISVAREEHFIVI